MKNGTPENANAPEARIASGAFVDGRESVMLREQPWALRAWWQGPPGPLRSAP